VTVRRLAAIALIFLGAAVAWTVLGSSLLARTGQFDGRLEREVELLWGGPHRQVTPNAWILRPGVDTETVETKGDDGRITRRHSSRSISCWRISSTTSTCTWRLASRPPSASRWS
jgi:hypothetical protein